MSVGSDAVRWELAVAGAKMAAFAELKVRRWCSLLVIGGDVVEVKVVVVKAVEVKVVVVKAVVEKVVVVKAVVEKVVVVKVVVVVVAK